MCIVIGWPLRTICRWKVRRDNGRFSRSRLLTMPNVLNRLVSWKDIRVDIGLSSIFCLFWICAVEICIFGRRSASARYSSRSLRLGGNRLVSTFYGYSLRRGLAIGNYVRILFSIHSCAKNNTRIPYRYYSTTWPKTNVTIERPWSESKMIIVSCLTLLNPGLFLVDHVHFQYNGFLIGILILSVSCVRKEQNLLAAALYVSFLIVTYTNDPHNSHSCQQ